MPTLLAAAGVSYPAAFAGETIAPAEGISLLPLLAPGGSVARGKPLFFEHEGERAIIDGDWKLMSLNNQPWELYDLSVDPQELNNLAASDAARVASMEAAWFAWAHPANVKDYPPTALPRITLTTTDATATAAGPTTGEMELGRDSSAGALPVALAIGGTAVPGTDYQALAGTQSFSSGQSKRTLTITPAPGGVTRESRSVRIGVKPMYHYIEPQNVEEILISPHSYQSWIEEKLPGASTAAQSPLADPDGDGAPNFIERGRGTEPGVADPSAAGEPGFDAEGLFTFTFLEDPGAPEVSWRLQLSHDLLTWRDAGGEMSFFSTASGRLDEITAHWTESPPGVARQFARLAWSYSGPVPDVVIARYDFAGGSRASADPDAATTAGNYAGGTIGAMPNETRSPSAGSVTYTTGAETNPSATHSFTVNMNGHPASLGSLAFTCHATNIAFDGSAFSYQLTSSLTGGTVLASRTFASNTGGTADFSAAESVDLTGQAALQNVTGAVTFTFTFTDNSSGTVRSHGIGHVVLSKAESAPD